MKDQYVIIDLRDMDFMKDKDGRLITMIQKRMLALLVVCMNLKMLG